MTTFQRSMYSYGLYIAWLISLVATLGSLYLSEIMLFEPCKLCWLQRIFMYPLTILLGIACFKNDYKITPYALALSIPGGLIALYHYLEQKVPVIQAIAPCRIGVPCHLDYLDWFGWLTIPMMALIAFVLITITLFLVVKGERMVGIR